MAQGGLQSHFWSDFHGFRLPAAMIPPPGLPRLDGPPQVGFHVMVCYVFVLIRKGCGDLRRKWLDAGVVVD